MRRLQMRNASRDSYLDPNVLKLVLDALTQVDTDEQLDEIVDVRRMQEPKNPDLGERNESDTSKNKYVATFKSKSGKLCEIEWTNQIEEDESPENVDLRC
ncbi:Hypothetical protein NTJ_14772 [Nesidiocoris tenuis]|uniref:Uncharacterized protein n=1 Tax=Nesidiocoris tenuis TaxID=355587 RepID=A0ABN7BC54_9HEMI|nr:Hypothetical protein NTJ_14772 [Nesidiocoris tenuis]